ncbi:MAG: hypothetical protein RBU30_04935 [Polyangia bacterium]|jgi:hypothetical protein|nr:hypothetical protein [Polyangia bacterium]
MPIWNDRRVRTLTAEVTQFLEGLTRNQRLRKRLEARGYTEQDHRGLQACLARMEGLAAAGTERRAEAATRGEGSGLERFLGWGPAGQARALLGWAVQQARMAAEAARKAPSVARELKSLAAKAGEETPWETLEAARVVLGRVGADDHLGHFLTPSGLRDASAELRRRLREGGSPAARSTRLQAHAELAFLFARCRRLALDELAGEPSALRALGLQTSG